MPQSQQIILIVAILLAVDALIVWVLLHSFRAYTWGPLQQAYPPRDVVEPSVSRNFQSFSFDLFNMGFCVHVVVDEHCLHLRPSALLRLIGCGPMSIPWDAIDFKGGRGRWLWRRAKIGKVAVMGPLWCMRLAERPAGSAKP
ncbi:MAG: hypothetical protein SFY69_08130 [Planctomycetota bacterium]|nr:hypothetical protein [Planctomycetota bacterium]